jgi:opacity protein-like surface antigen
MLNGFHVGGGLKKQFGRNAYGKVEYDYTRLRGYDALSIPGVPDDEFDRHQVKLGLDLRM